MRPPAPSNALDLIDRLPSPDQPVLIAGPTASGKSALALAIAEAGGGIVINADALQVYDGWRILTARPSYADEQRAPHALYGHVAFDESYSVGDWLRAVEPFITSGPRPIIVGGTGLYFRALTEGLATIPATPPEIRARADRMDKSELLAILDAVDPTTAQRVDRHNVARLRRAWEVWESTGRSISVWQSETPPPRLPIDQAAAFVLDPAKERLNARIEERFDWMLEHGALDEARANLLRWPEARGAAKAIGAPELIAHLRGEISLADARNAGVIATRQYAKRQRTWFRARMSAWTRLAWPR